VIEMAARPDAFCRWGQEEKFMGWGGYLPCREKSNFLSSFLNGTNQGAGQNKENSHGALQRDRRAW
jgi:hypothetical protein